VLECCFYPDNIDGVIYPGKNGFMLTTTEILESEEQRGFSFTAFAGSRRIACGSLMKVARDVKEAIDGGIAGGVLIFDDATSETMELDLRGTVDDVLRRTEACRSVASTAASAPSGTARGPGRPKLGVIAKEVTLLPRHWDWLGLQPGGASVALRKLVEEARRANSGRDCLRRAQEVGYRFMSAMAGDYPGFEEASRAFFAGDQKRFNALVEPWPADVRDHARTLASAAFQATGV